MCPPVAPLPAGVIMRTQILKTSLPLPSAVHLHLVYGFSFFAQNRLLEEYIQEHEGFFFPVTLKAYHLLTITGS